MGDVARLYVRSRPVPGPLVLDGEAARRLATALRVRPGDEVRLFAGEGHEWLARVQEVDRGRAVLEVAGLARQEPPPEPVVEAWVPVARAQRLEWAIEQCTEAGADIIRTVAMADGQRAEAMSAANRARWERVAIEASERCGRLYLPVIEGAQRLERVLASYRGALVVVDREGRRPGELAPLLPERGRVAVVGAPEGGFAPLELANLRAKGALFLRAGPHVLRAETATLAGVVLVRSLTG
jgi:16S rRNA (uracil1498-N3)-methyltransferase